MKNIFKTFMMLMAVLAFSGCLSSTDDTGFTPETPQISFSEESLSIDQAGGELTVNLRSNLPWRIKSDSPWVAISKDHGPEGEALTITIQKNRTRDERKATLTAWVTEEYTARLEVLQDPASASEAFTYYVKADGDGLAEGFTWETATTLPTAIERAADGDKICIAAGTYSPITLITGGEEEKERTYEIHSNFTIEGGYPADATTGAVADPAVHKTIFDGLENVYHVVTVSAVKSNQPVVLKNLTITGGRSHTTTEAIMRSAGASVFDAAYGGGINIGNSNVQMINCTVKNNAACHAAGCFISPGAVVSLEKCVFESNSADNNGGGVWNSGGNVTMTDCTIAKNTSGQQAAGYYSIDGAGALSISRIYNCAFYENDNTKKAEKRSGGALYIRANSDAVFVNCSFTGNKAGWGAVVSGHGTTALPSKTTFISCTMTGNHATSGGGALFAYNVGAMIEAYNCIVSGNTSAGYAPEAGVLDGVDATRVKVAHSILASSLVDAAGAQTGSWSFSPESMLGAFGLYENGFTMCFPLNVSADNPAVDQGMTNEALQELAAGFTPAVDGAKVTYDQNGTARTKKSIGSYTTK